MKRILVVEDNDDNMLLVRFMLEETGYEVIEARDGAEGVALAVQEKPDLVIMDIQLPDIDGLEATRRIRNLECGLRNKIEEGPYSESEIPGPDLADQDDVMEKEVWEASKSNGISKSTRARAGRNLKSQIKKIPIVALTSFAMAGDREKTLAAGCTGYIEKPINPDTFMEEIEKYL